MKLRSYLMIGIICAILFVAWTAIASNQIIIPTTWGKVFVTLPKEIPDFVNSANSQYMPGVITGNIGVLQNNIGGRIYQLYVVDDAPVVKGVVVQYPDGTAKFWIYRNATPNYSGEPKLVDVEQFTSFLKDKTIARGHSFYV